MRRGAAALAALLFSLPGVVHAQPVAEVPQDPEARKVLAKQRFDEGSKLYEQKAYDVALTEFKKSYALYKSRPAGQNAALVLRSIGDRKSVV